MRQACHSGRLPAALLLVAPLGIACHSHSQSASSSSIATPALASVVRAADSNAVVSLQIANHNWSDVIIYVLRDGQPSRIGVATAASSTSFVLPRRMFGQAGEIQFWGRPIGAAGNAYSESVIVQPGQWIEWTLEDDLNRSAIGVF